MYHRASIHPPCTHGNPKSKLWATPSTIRVSPPNTLQNPRIFSSGISTHPPIHPFVCQFIFLIHLLHVPYQPSHPPSPPISPSWFGSGTGQPANAKLKQPSPPCFISAPYKRGISRITGGGMYSRANQKLSKKHIPQKKHLQRSQTRKEPLMPCCMQTYARIFRKIDYFFIT